MRYVVFPNFDGGDAFSWINCVKMMKKNSSINGPWL